MRIIFALGTTLLLACTAAPAADAWLATGHMIVAQIAYDELSPEARHEGDRLLRSLGVDSFLPAASWMDDIKGHGWRLFDSWHYINQPYSIDQPGSTNQPDKTPDTPPSTGDAKDLDGEFSTHNAPLPEMDIVRAIHQASEVLSTTQAGDLERGLALLFLVHLVADLHQPLHAISRHSSDHPQGDQGGNLLRLDAANDNLHRFWDGLAGLFPEVESRTDGGRQQVRRFVAQIRKQEPKASMRAWQADTPEQWAAESYHHAVETAYVGISAGRAPSTAYTAAAQQVVRHRLALAGYRLGALLEHCLVLDDPISDDKESGD